MSARAAEAASTHWLLDLASVGGLSECGGYSYRPTWDWGAKEDTVYGSDYMAGVVYFIPVEQTPTKAEAQ